mgnify:FL=1
MKRLLRLTALALGLTLLLSACGHKNTEPERKDAATQTVPVEGITGLTLCDGDVTLRFEKDEAGNWIWHDDPTFPLEQSAMDELLALPAALDGGETVTDGQELSAYGLETPAKYITVTADGEDATYYVGEETTDGRWYVLTPDGRVLYASAESKALLSRSIYDMAVLPQLPVIAPEQVVSVTILTPERTVAFLADEDGVRRSASRDVTAQTAALVEELGALTVTACVDYHPAEGAAAVCGLDDPALTLAMNYLSDTGADKALTLAVGLPTGDGGRYVTLDGETTIYRMEEASLAQLLTIAETGL